MSVDLNPIQHFSDLIKELEPQKQKLHYILERTEDAVQTTLNLTEQLLVQQEKEVQQRTVVMAALQRALSHRDSEDKRLILQLVMDYLIEEQNQENLYQTNLTGILMAQSFQDLTGQVIQQVIQLTDKLSESSLSLSPLTPFDSDPVDRQKSTDVLQGPVNDSPESRQDQDDVDRLLAEMGLPSSSEK